MANKKKKVNVYDSTKVFATGLAVVFRQWKAEGTHCSNFSMVPGISFKVWFEGEPDERNWVWDFGGMRIAILVEILTAKLSHVDSLGVLQPMTLFLNHSGEWMKQV